MSSAETELAHLDLKLVFYKINVSRQRRLPLPHGWTGAKRVCSGMSPWAWASAPGWVLQSPQKPRLPPHPCLPCTRGGQQGGQTAALLHPGPPPARMPALLCTRALSIRGLVAAERAVKGPDKANVPGPPASRPSPEWGAGALMGPGPTQQGRGKGEGGKPPHAPGRQRLGVTRWSGMLEDGRRVACWDHIPSPQGFWERVPNS